MHDYAIQNLKLRLTEVETQVALIRSQVRQATQLLQAAIRDEAHQAFVDYSDSTLNILSQRYPGFITPLVKSAMASAPNSQTLFILKARLAAFISGMLKTQIHTAPLRHKQEEAAALGKQIKSMRLAIAGLEEAKRNGTSDVTVSRVTVG